MTTNDAKRRYWRIFADQGIPVYGDLLQILERPELPEEIQEGGGRSERRRNPRAEEGTPLPEVFGRRWTAPLFIAPPTARPLGDPQDAYRFRHLMTKGRGSYGFRDQDGTEEILIDGKSLADWQAENNVIAGAILPPGRNVRTEEGRDDAIFDRRFPDFEPFTLYANEPATGGVVWSPWYRIRFPPLNLQKYYAFYLDPLPRPIMTLAIRFPNGLYASRSNGASVTHTVTLDWQAAIVVNGKRWTTNIMSGAETFDSNDFSAPITEPFTVRFDDSTAHLTGAYSEFIDVRVSRRDALNTPSGNITGYYDACELVGVGASWNLSQWFSDQATSLYADLRNSGPSHFLVAGIRKLPWVSYEGGRTKGNLVTRRVADALVYALHDLGGVPLENINLKELGAIQKELDLQDLGLSGTYEREVGTRTKLEDLVRDIAKHGRISVTVKAGRYSFVRTRRRLQATAQGNVDEPARLACDLNYRDTYDTRTRILTETHPHDCVHLIWYDEDALNERTVYRYPEDALAENPLEVEYAGCTHWEGAYRYARHAWASYLYGQEEISFDVTDEGRWWRVGEVVRVQQSDPKDQMESVEIIEARAASVSPLAASDFDLIYYGRNAVNNAWDAEGNFGTTQLQTPTPTNFNYGLSTPYPHPHLEEALESQNTLDPWNISGTDASVPASVPDYVAGRPMRFSALYEHDGTPSNLGVLLSLAGAGSEELEISINNAGGGAVGFAVRNMGGTFTRNIVTSNAFSAGWHLLEMVYDGATTVTLFLDGVQEGSGSLPFSIATTTLSRIRNRDSTLSVKMAALGYLITSSAPYTLADHTNTYAALDEAGGIRLRHPTKTDLTNDWLTVRASDGESCGVYRVTAQPSPSVLLLDRPLEQAMPAVGSALGLLGVSHVFQEQGLWIIKELKQTNRGFTSVKASRYDVRMFLGDSQVVPRKPTLLERQQEYPPA